MREIKFRAWSFDPLLEQPEMLSHEDLDRLDSEGLEHLFDIINGSSKHIIPMQYTGLKDKKGVDIYEGDILKTFRYRLEKISDIEQVGYERGSFHTYSKNDVPVLLHYHSELDIEVIGNIHQNPELL